MELIEKRVLGSSLSEVNFTGPWADYTDIEVYLNVFFTGSGGADGVKVQFNGDTGANYNFQIFETTGGSSIYASSATNDTSIWMTYRPSGSTDVPVSARVRFFEVNSTSTMKSLASRYGSIEGYGGTYNGAWKNTNALSSFKFIKGVGASNFLTGSTFLVYGVKA